MISVVVEIIYVQYLIDKKVFIAFAFRCAHFSSRTTKYIIKTHDSAAKYSQCAWHMTDKCVFTGTKKMPFLRLHSLIVP